MDTNDLKNEEKTLDQTQQDNSDVSLDEMMAQAVPDSEEVKSEETTDETPEINPEQAVEKTVEVIDEPVDEPVEDKTQEENDSQVEDQIEDIAQEEQEETVDEAVAEPSEEETTPVSTPLPPRKEYKGKWYIVHTYSGHENKVAKTLMQRVQAMGFENTIYDALVPTRDTIRVRGGKKETIKEKIFPGYILVNMELSDEAWVLVRTTPGVTSFVGAQNKPTPIRDDEVQAIVAFVGQKDPVYKAQFSVGEAVKITDGPFSDFLGTVESIDEGKGKIKVLVSIFGRETPVELDFLQVAKI